MDKANNPRIAWAITGIDLNKVRVQMPVYRNKATSTSAPPVGHFYKGYYHTLVVAPEIKKEHYSFGLTEYTDRVDNVEGLIVKVRERLQ